MTKHKQYAFKKRLMKKSAQNRRVPAWIMRRTNRNVVRNPKRRTWRRGHLHLG